MYPRSPLDPFLLDPDGLVPIFRVVRNFNSRQVCIEIERLVTPNRVGRIQSGWSCHWPFRIIVLKRDIDITKEWIGGE